MSEMNADGNMTISGYATCNGAYIGEVDLTLKPILQDQDDDSRKIVAFELDGMPDAGRVGCVVVDDGTLMHRFPKVVGGWSIPNVGYDPPAFYESWGRDFDMPERDRIARAKERATNE